MSLIYYGINIIILAIILVIAIYSAKILKQSKGQMNLTINAKPNEWLIVLDRQGKIKTAGVGIIALIYPYEQTIQVKNTINKLQFKILTSDKNFVQISIQCVVIWNLIQKEEEIYKAYSYLGKDLLDETPKKTNEILINLSESSVRSFCHNTDIFTILQQRDFIRETLMSSLNTITVNWGINIDDVEIQSMNIVQEKLQQNLETEYKCEKEEESKLLMIDQQARIKEQQLKNELENFTKNQEKNYSQFLTEKQNELKKEKQNQQMAQQQNSMNLKEIQRKNKNQIEQQQIKEKKQQNSDRITQKTFINRINNEIAEITGKIEVNEKKFLAEIIDRNEEIKLQKMEFEKEIENKIQTMKSISENFSPSYQKQQYFKILSELKKKFVVKASHLTLAQFEKEFKNELQI